MTTESQSKQARRLHVVRRKVPVLNDQKYDAKNFLDLEVRWSIVEFHVCQILAHHDNVSYVEAKVWQKEQSDRNFHHCWPLRSSTINEEPYGNS